MLRRLLPLSRVGLAMWAWRTRGAALTVSVVDGVARRVHEKTPA